MQLSGRWTTSTGASAPHPHARRFLSGSRSSARRLRRTSSGTPLAGPTSPLLSAEPESLLHGPGIEDERARPPDNHEPAATSSARTSGTVAFALGRRPAQAAVPPSPLVLRQSGHLFRTYGYQDKRVAERNLGALWARRPRRTGSRLRQPSETRSASARSADGPTQPS
jgi:hypothetical protein